jgi:hypothetical protein
MCDKEELEIPEEMKQLMIDWKIYTECRDEAVVSFFKAKRAIYYGRKAFECNSKFWRMAKDLYPQIGDGTWEYKFLEQKLFKN